jgi:hypothetical protein
VSTRTLAQLSIIASIVAVSASVALAFDLVAHDHGAASVRNPAGTAVETRTEQARSPSTGAEHASVSPSDAAFWQLTEDARREAGNDTARQSELLEERLKQLPPQSIVEFGKMRQRLDRQAYTWNMWGAALVVEDSCSEDCFRDFRAYVISLGRDAYESAIQNPDSLAPVAENAELGDWENADNVAPEAYSSVTGDDFPPGDSDLSGDPAGPKVDTSANALRHRYPRLSARFRSG